MENIQRENADILDAIWAALAQTVIPPQPVSGQAYRNPAVEKAVIQLGQKFNSVADSALLNQFLYLLSNYVVAMGQRGILPWISAQKYREGGLCLGPDGSLWQAQTDIEAGDTTVPGTDTPKWDVPIINGQKIFSLPPNGQPGQILTKTETGAGWTNQGNYSNVFSLQTSTQLDESHFGSLIFAGLDTAGVVMTLPKSDAAAKGKKITISSNRAGVTINPYEGDHIRFGNFTNTENGFLLPSFSVVSLVSNGNSNWTVTSEVASGFLGASGYKRFPDGMILQWGSDVRNATGGVTWTNYHIPFNTIPFVSVSAFNSGEGSMVSACLTNRSKTNFRWSAFYDGHLATIESQVGCFWKAIGY